MTYSYEISDSVPADELRRLWAEDEGGPKLHGFPCPEITAGGRHGHRMYVPSADDWLWSGTLQHAGIPFHRARYL